MAEPVQTETANWRPQIPRLTDTPDHSRQPVCRITHSEFKTAHFLFRATTATAMSPTRTGLPSEPPEKLRKREPEVAETRPHVPQHLAAEPV
jgi:hypothetical protein